MNIYEGPGIVRSAITCSFHNASGKEDYVCPHFTDAKAGSKHLIMQLWTGRRET